MSAVKVYTFMQDTIVCVYNMCVCDALTLFGSIPRRVIAHHRQRRHQLWRSLHALIIIFMYRLQSIRHFDVIDQTNTQAHTHIRPFDYPFSIARRVVDRMLRLS